MAWTAVLFSPFAWLRKPPKTDYEEVLADLTKDIDQVQTNLVQIRARTRRASLILPFWATVAWLIWTAACYFAGLLSGSHAIAGARVRLWVVWGPVVLAPLIIFSARRIVKWWYKRVQAAEDKHLKELQKQRRAKIEEIKKATRYDHLRKLLETYDRDPQAVAPQQQRASAGPQTPRPAQGPLASQSHSVGHGPQNAAARGGPASSRPVGAAAQPLPSGMRTGPQFAQPPGQMPAQQLPMRRTWLDRMADAVLGADPTSGALGPEQKYALICSKCHRHNGLATRDEFDEIQYVCPHCGSFESRRPSSVPVSSPWKTSETPNRPVTPSSPAPRSALSRGGVRPSEDGSDSPPPASPLAASAHGHVDAVTDDSDSGEMVEAPAGGDAEADKQSSAAGLSRRSGAARSAEAAMELD